jgi:hypothetical protein
MRARWSVFVALVLLIGWTVTPAVAHWDPGESYKMHYPQLPIDLVDSGLNGIDVAFELGRLADDWQCTESGEVTDIHFWISWENNTVGAINGFTVAIWSDNPVGPDGYSIPGGLLWSRDFGPGGFVVRDMEDHAQDWFNPWTGEYVTSDHSMWQQINIVDIEDPFYQEAGSIYWLEIDMWGAEFCGWKVSGSEHFRDNGVYWDFPQFKELRDPNTLESFDLAFVITQGGPTAAESGTWGRIKSLYR